MSVKFVFKNLTLFTVLLILFVMVKNDLSSRDSVVASSVKYFKRTTLNITENLEQEHLERTRRFFKKRKNWVTSNLGSILFKNESAVTFQNNIQKDKTFTILVWKYWNWLQNRHLNKNGDPLNVLEGCSVQNCKFVKEDSYIDKADAVIIHTQRGVIPKVKTRNPRSRWIFLNDEAPTNMFSLSGGKGKLEKMADIFNWTMTYRSDSDIPVPYGRTLPLSEPIKTNLMDAQNALENLVPYWKTKNKVSMVLMSNCVSTRLNFIKALRQYVSVDVYGKCSDVMENMKACPGHFFQDCLLSSTYIFYLVLENASCLQYLTEKVFQHAYDRGAIPVIMGTPLKDCKRLLPSNSYLHFSNYKNVEELAKHMHRIFNNKKLILSMHTWRIHFKVKSEHGYFGTKSYHYCRVCEALNYNDNAPKTYSLNDLRLLFDTNSTCDMNYRTKNFESNEKE